MPAIAHGGLRPPNGRQDREEEGIALELNTT